jgi:hypothetical protein
VAEVGPDVRLSFVTVGKPSTVLIFRVEESITMVLPVLLAGTQT